MEKRMSVTFTTRLLTTVAGIVAGGTILDSPAQAGDATDLAQYSCASFLADSPELQANFMIWFDGYLSHAMANGVLNFEVVARNLEAAQRACRAVDPASFVLDVMVFELPNGV
jgi:hypothetical protein